ncbi:heat shock protein 30 [Stipitochalara longipes BDJ]|nr:heat shock protein 30 [Stipitochalara longipes BDJ]
MSLFPRSFLTADPAYSFQPLFRMLDDFDQYSRQGDRDTPTSLKTFTPKFDVKEVKDAYELHGELPGIEQKDVEIEFTDAHTLTIKGRTERSYTSGTPPAGFVEGTPARGAIEGSNEHKAHKATVEDEGTEATSTEVTKKEEPAQPKEPESKFWVSERSVGEFSRSFTFPSRVDQDGVTATMKNGLLSIVVPKHKKSEPRKITIS